MTNPTLRLAFVALLVAAAPSMPLQADVRIADARAEAFRLDPDPAARYVPLPINIPERVAQRDRLVWVDRGLQRFPDHPLLLKERGFIRHQLGQADAAEADYARALQVAGSNAFQRRHILWSQGWARFESGRNDAALASWREAKALHGGRPFWWGYSAALAEWRLGRRDEAVALYAEAVRGMPEWGLEGGLAKRTAHWPEHQFKTASEVFEAWKATRP
jgi:tetratricopeptide (TPR) repeat protein